MWYAITGAIAVILIIILSILIYRFLKEKDKKEAENKKQSSRILKFIFFFALLFVLDIPFVINESYKFGKWYHTLWGADDVLAFYGSFLSFLGTVVLGIIAIYQNKRANEVNESIMELTRRDKMAYLTPKPTIINSNRTIIFDFINKGNSFGIIKLITLQKDRDIIFQKAVEDFVDCEEEYKFDTGLELSDLKIKNEKFDFCMTVELLIQNPFGYEYIEKIIMNFISEDREKHILYHQKNFNIVFRNSKEAL